MQPAKPTLQWGVIIVTGISAFLVVVLGGYFIQQVGRTLKEMLNPSPTPDASIPVLALEIPHEGHWFAEIQVWLPHGERLTQQLAGSGNIYPLWQASLPAGAHYSIEYTFQIAFTVPNLQVEGLIAVQPNILSADPLEYYHALHQKYFALYNANNTFLYVRAEPQLAALPNLRIGIWQP